MVRYEPEDGLRHRLNRTPSTPSARCIEIGEWVYTAATTFRLPAGNVTTPPAPRRDATDAELEGNRTTTAVATQEQKPLTLAQLIEQMKPEIGPCAAEAPSPDRTARIATTVPAADPSSPAARPESFLGALMTASQPGLEPGPLGEAYLVLFGNAVTFIPGYRGLRSVGTSGSWPARRHIWGRDCLRQRHFPGNARPVPRPGIEPATRTGAVYAAAEL